MSESLPDPSAVDRSSPESPLATPPVVLVRQEHPNGCGIAAMAMVAGMTYGQVREALEVGLTRGRDYGEYGIHHGIVEWFLGSVGFVWRTLYLGWGLDPWPPAPFAPVHMAQVRQPSGNTHYVVVTSDGTVLDPLSDEPRSLAEWKTVNNVFGFWRLTTWAGAVTQPSLFDATPVTAVRKHDPRTAKAAAALDPEGRATQAQRILRYLYRFGGTITADRAYRLLTLPDEDIARGEWSSRIGVLIKRGLLERAGEVEDVGRRARRRQVLQYRLTPAGEAETDRMFGGAE